MRAARRGGTDGWTLIKFTPFDPLRKMSEATVRDPGGQNLHVVKGAYAVVAALAAPSAAAAMVETLQSAGNRVLAIAAGAEGALKIAGVIALETPTGTPYGT